jgi:ABC-type multidrug transport system ATPase subunit/predicted component of type VI protein secretion system
VQPSLAGETSVTSAASALCLEISGAGIDTREVPLLAGSTVIGRGETSTIVLSHPTVSRRHAEIRVGDRGVQVADQGSANGTWLNRIELPVKVWHQLVEDELLEIGPFSIELKRRAASSLRAGALPAVAMAGGSETVVITQAVLPLLRVVMPDGGSRDIKLTAPVYTLGRAPENDIVIDDRRVSRHHARLEKRGASYQILDLGSTNGLTLDGQRVQDRLLSSGDVLGIAGAVKLEFSTADHAAGEKQRVAPIDLRARAEVVLGRGGAAEGGLDHPQVSRVHARVTSVDGRLRIEDAGSDTGTFVNGRRVTSAAIEEGDEIRIGGQALKLAGGQLHPSVEDDLTLDAFNLRRVVASGTTILQDVSLSIRSREFVAIVGPSGCGKSTLLTALCGYQQATSGNVLINGTDYYSHVDAFRTEIGFLPQDDIIHRELNIRRAFNYAARLRMPEDTESHEIERRGLEVMEELSLSSHADTPVRQLSGGQRKRVSIGVELLTQPSFLFLDEATSGLDPGTETQMMRLFRHLADNGRIILLVTHATKNVMICDKVAFMAKGGYLAYYGPPEDALAYFGTEDFDEIYLRLEERPGQEWADAFNATLSAEAQAKAQPLQAREIDKGRLLKAAPPRSAFGQFLTLASRNLEILWRSKKDVAILFALAPFLGLLNFVLWDPQTLDPVEGDSVDAMNIFLVLTIVTILVGSLGSVREIVKEQAIYKRERMVCLQVLPYIMSKVAVGFCFALYSSLMLFLLQVAAVDFSHLSRAEILQLFVPVFLATFSGVMIGLLVSALSATEERAMLLIIGVIIPQILLCGSVFPIRELGGIGPYLTIPATSKWAIASLMTTAKVKSGDCLAPDLSDCSIPGLAGIENIADRQSLYHSLDRYGGIFDVNLAAYWAAMVGLISVVLVLVLLIQKRKDSAR